MEYKTFIGQLSSLDKNNYWLVLLACTLFILLNFIIESIAHRRRLRGIPIRIHVNGTRGKSSLTRLISAGLRAGGITTCAKTTGTLPRFIRPNGTEEAIYRPGKANILEQIKTIKKAYSYQTQALVIECMAVQPLLQSISEWQIVRATHSVISNARADHLDVMGPTKHHVARALSATVSIKGRTFTAEQELFHIFEYAALDRQSRISLTTPEDIAAISDADMKGFCYTEHKENVALALQVCASLGISRETALQGMWQARPDPGALTTHEINWENHRLVFVNGFAANDPFSTGQLWHDLLKQYPNTKRRIAIVNCRNDRKQRSKQLAEACAKWKPADLYLVVGTGTDAFLTAAAHEGISKIKLIDAHDWSVGEIFYNIAQTDQELFGNALKPLPTLIVGMGNIAGIGFKIVDYFAYSYVKDLTNA